MRAVNHSLHTGLLVISLVIGLVGAPLQAQPVVNETWSFKTSAGGNGATVADLDRDGKAEVLYAGRVAGYSGKSCISVLQGGASGAMRPGWPKCYTGSVEFGAAPTVADIGRGGMAVIAVSGGSVSGVQGVYAWDKDGNTLSGFPRLFDPMNPCNGCTPSTYDDNWSQKRPKAGSFVLYPNASPTVADITGSGPSIIVTIPAANDTYGEFYGFVLVLDPYGRDRPGFPFFVSQAIFGTVAVGDVDGDGANEIMTGTDAGRPLVIKGNGQPVRSFGRHNSSPGSTYQMHPTLVDLNGDGTLDPMLMTWLEPDQTLAEDYAGLPGLHVFDRFGRRMGGSTFEWPYPWADDEGNLPVDSAHAWPDTAWVPQSSPVSVDIDGDGTAEIFVAGWDGKLHYLRWSGADLVEAGQFVPPGGPAMQLMMSEPVIADVDGDGGPEIVIGAYDASNKVPNSSGGLYAWHLNGSLASGFPLSVGYGVKAPLAVGDTNGDGRLDIIAFATDGTIHNLTTAGLPTATLWSQHHANAAHTGRGWNWAENHAPKQPRIRSSAAGTGYNAIAWDVATPSGITSFAIYRCQPGAGGRSCIWNSEFTLLERVDASYQTYVDRTVTGNQPVVYKVAAGTGASDIAPWSPPRSPYASPMHTDGAVSALVPGGMEENLISNGGFEIASSPVSSRLRTEKENIFQDWDRVADPDYSPNWSLPQRVGLADAHSGRYALKLHSINGGTYMDMAQPLRYELNGQNSPVVPDAGINLRPNVTYELGFWVKVTNGSANVFIALSDNTILGANLQFYTPDQCSTRNTYKYCSTRITGNGHSFFLSIWVNASTPGADVYIDDVQIRDLSVLPPLALRKGWNLVGLQGMLSGTSVSQGLQSIAGLYASVTTMQPGCIAGNSANWQFLSPRGPYSLSGLNGTQGYWLDMAQSALLYLESRDATQRDPAATLCPGWNLMAYPGSTARSVTAPGTLPTTVTQVLGFNNDGWQGWRAGLPAYANTLTTLQPGMAYWLYNSGTAIPWSVP